MNELEWVDSVIGKPWEKFAQGPKSFDCWGLVVDFFSRVKGINLDDIEGYVNGTATIQSAFNQEVSSWSESDCGYVAVSFSQGLATHVGVRIGNRIIHAFGNEAGTGRVANQTISQFKRLYRGEIKLYKWVGK